MYVQCFLLLTLLEIVLFGNAVPTANEEIVGWDLESEHPLLQSLKRYQIIVPGHYEDAKHERKRRDLITELSNATGVHLTDTFFTVEVEGKTYELDLSINKELLPHSYAISSYEGNGMMEMHKPTNNEQNHCYYQGHVRGVEDSKVVLSTCNGLKGCIILPNDFLIIEPLATRAGSQIREHKHVLYRPSDVKETNPAGSCGSEEGHEWVKQLSGLHTMNHTRHKRGLKSEIKYIELMVVADSAEARKFNPRDVLEARIKELVNYVDAFFHKLDMRVVLSHIEIWNKTDRVSLPTNAAEVLDGFLTFRESQMESQPSTSAWVYADNFHLLYGRDFNETIVGIASSQSMCGRRSGGVTQDYSSNVLYTAAVTAHELGHNFGMVHDTSDCSCPEDHLCVMSKSAGIMPASEWSTCSRAYLEQNFEFGLRVCLLNVPMPSRMYWTPVCGNDIVEEGEECDCGHTYDCTSDCCNASTCMLLPGAQCDVGGCCSDCQLLEAGIECRTSESLDCDLAEYCTGNSSQCPTNAFIENGIPCSNDTALCYDGICLTHDLQCQSIWGHNASSSDDLCYTEINIYGNANGNCGHDNEGVYTKCTPENAKCGKLHCTGGKSRPTVGRERQSYTSRILVGSTELVCKALDSADGSIDFSHPGLVRDGTICADGMMCMKGECTSIPTSVCSLKCSGHGHCSNTGSCHCDPGWEPPYCNVAETVGTECGNGIVNQGEECDCGNADTCTSNCCNATSCRFLPGAVCGGGLCCSDCHFSSPGTICRGRNNNVCDLLEYCTGTSPDCPEDVFDEDGTPCRNGDAICYKGVCFTRDLQCQELWGGGALSSGDPCYTYFNARGISSGNCGYDENGNYIPCESESAKCGTLQCQGGAPLPIVSGFARVHRNGLNNGQEIFECKRAGTFTIQENRKTLVRNYTTCSPGKVCISGECVAAEAQDVVSTTCTSHCGGHGHCDNLGHCHCDRGWQPPHCDVEGTGIPECGNKIVEEEEECDCGHPGQCASTCCDPATCHLVVGAVCDSGVCCTDCQHVAGGTVCRDSGSNSCDLSEYCTGYSADCPDNVYIENGTPCENEAAFCYDGICRTYDQQCQTIWGEDASGSDDLCYTYVNKLGNPNGNCGPDGEGGYLTCTDENEKCGKLQCKGGGRRPVSVKYGRGFPNKLRSQTQIIVCKTIESAGRADDPGLVSDGTACGASQMCVNATCIAVSPLTCSLKCNGNGVCNHLHHCHCDPGWGPPYCDHPGSGGSVDSESIVHDDHYD